MQTTFARVALIAKKLYTMWVRNVTNFRAPLCFWFVAKSWHPEPRHGSIALAAAAAAAAAAAKRVEGCKATVAAEHRRAIPAEGAAVWFEGQTPAGKSVVEQAK